MAVLQIALPENATDPQVAATAIARGLFPMLKPETKLNLLVHLSNDIEQTVGEGMTIVALGLDTTMESQDTDEPEVGFSDLG